MNKISKILVFSLILLVGLSVVSATDDLSTEPTDVGITEVESSDDTTTTTDTCPCDNPITTTNNVVVNNANTITSFASDTTYDIQEDINLGTITSTNLDKVVITTTTGAKLTNTVFELSGTNLQIFNLNMENTDYTGTPITITDSNKVVIGLNNITVNKNTAQESFGIKILRSNNTTVCKNNVTVTAVPQSMGWDDSTGVWLGAVQVSGILYSNVNNSKINCNNVTVNDSTTFTNNTYSTADGITVKGASENTTIGYNNINVTGSEYNYGVSLSEFVKNITVNNNTITMETINHLCGIQLSAGTESTIKGNKIYGNCTATSGQTASCEAFAYGIVVSTATYGASECESYYNTIEDNEIELNSTIAYGIELNNADYNNITNNTVHTYGNVTMGLGMYNSSYNNITNNHFVITGETRTLDSGIYEAIYPETTGIKINETSSDNIITGNRINVVDTAVSTYSIVLVSSGNTCDQNHMTSIKYVYNEDNDEYESSPLTGSDSIYQQGYSNTITNTNNAYQG